MTKEEEVQFDNLLNTDIGNIGLTVAAFNALKSKYINTVGQLIELQEKDVLSIPRVGWNILVGIRNSLTKLGLELGMRYTKTDNGIEPDCNKKMTVSDQMRLLRLEKNYPADPPSKSQLAEDAGVHYYSYLQIENADSRPEAEELISLAEYHGVTVADILYNTIERSAESDKIYMSSRNMINSMFLAVLDKPEKYAHSWIYHVATEDQLLELEGYIRERVVEIKQRRAREKQKEEQIKEKEKKLEKKIDAARPKYGHSGISYSNMIKRFAQQKKDQ